VAVALVDTHGHEPSPDHLLTEPLLEGIFDHHHAVAHEVFGPALHGNQLRRIG
jgi:hypothetical protein